MYFVVRIMHRVSDGNFIISGFTWETLNEAKHSFHDSMNTYAYGNNENYDYVAISIQAIDGRIIQSEIDNRLPVTE